MTAIAKQIDARMKAHNLSIMTLETKAGVKPHAVRNILTGKSKSPSAVNLQAIADVLGCSVKDLLTTPTVLQEEETHPSLEDLLQEKHANSPLMRDCVTTIENALQKAQKTITTGQFLTSVREVYLHSLQKNPQKVNNDFAEWFVDLMG
ncbi:MAG TPA: helix-turn-helix transcriptional regulator [Alphaproteobacteria bacterium]|nr:helix-turn-helix transcriptional regulator [Alphaproteobacteria bacterium]